MLLTGAAKSLFLGSLFVPTFSSSQKGGGKHGMLRRVLEDVPPGNLIEMLGEKNEQTVSFDRFLEYIEVAGFDYTTDVNYTLLAPTDEALVNFENRLINFEPTNPKEYFRTGAFVRYQVLLDTRLSTDFEDGEVDMDSSGYDNTFTQNPFAVNGSPVLIPNILATNGVIHALDSAVFPVDYWAFTDIMDTLAKDESFSTLISVLEATGLDVPLRTGKYTLLAPDNDAIAKLGGENIAFLTNPENEAELTEVLLYHVVQNVYCSCDVAAAGGILVLKTLQGGNITVDITGVVPYVEDAALNPFNVNILAGNGLVHAMFDVLLPSTVDIKRPTDSPTESPTAAPIDAAPTDAPIGAGGDYHLREVGNNGVPMAVFPLGKCEGDCDTDHDCSGSLKCYNLDGLGLGLDTVPGCSGYRRTTPVGATVDYCYEPEVDGTLKLNEVGNNGSPESAFPLGLCEGDCDSDDECADGYKCFDSNHGNTVPGCSGTRRMNKAGNYVDFCYAA